MNMQTPWGFVEAHEWTATSSCPKGWSFNSATDPEWREVDIVIFLKDENTTFRPEDGLAGKDAHH